MREIRHLCSMSIVGMKSLMVMISQSVSGTTAVTELRSFLFVLQQQYKSVVFAECVVRLV